MMSFHTGGQSDDGTRALMMSVYVYDMTSTLTLNNESNYHTITLLYCTIAWVLTDHQTVVKVEVCSRRAQVETSWASRKGVEEGVSPPQGYRPPHPTVGL